MDALKESNVPPPMGAVGARLYNRATQLLVGRVEVHRLQYKNCQYIYLGQYPLKMYDFFPDLHLSNRTTTSPYPDHSTGPKPIQLVQVVFTIE